MLRLTVKDLDFDEEVINVVHQLQRSRNMKYYIESTKTTSGTRKIPMTEEVKELCQRIVANRNKPKREPSLPNAPPRKASIYKALRFFRRI